MDKKSTNTTKTAAANGTEPAATAEPASSGAVAEPAVVVVDQTNTPAAEPSEAMPATDAATGAPVDTVVIVKPPKKKKVGLIAGLIIAALLILGGVGVAVWYFAVYQNPENAVFDAVNHLITAKHVSPHGSFQTTVASSNGYNVELTITAKSSSRRLPNESSLWLALNVRDASGELATDEALEVEIGAIQMADGVVYLKLSQLTETFEQLLPNIFPPTDCGPLADCLPSENPIETALYEVAELLDDEWWQISLPDILDELGDVLEDWQAEAITEIYTCSLDAMKADTSGEIAALYRDHRFVNVETLVDQTARPSGTTAYTVSLNYDALADFLNVTKHSSAATAFYDCYNAAIDKASQNADDYYTEEDFDDMKISLDDAKDVTAKDLEKYLPKTADLTFYIDDWGHALRQVEVTTDNGGSPATLSIRFDYTAQPEASAPAEYRPITELFDEIGQIITDLYYDDFEPDFSCDEDDLDLCYNGEFTFPLEIGV